jgi:hypothetical protein
MSTLRAIYRKTAGIRLWLGVVWLCELFGITFLIIAGLLQHRDADSSLLFTLHLPHFFTLILTLAVVLNGRNLERFLNILFPVYLIAFGLDVMAVFARSVLVFMAETSLQRRGELITVVVIVLFLFADAMGTLFVEQLAASIKRENVALYGIGGGSSTPRQINTNNVVAIALGISSSSSSSSSSTTNAR